MKVFTAQCRDAKSGLFMVASDCSYNMACFFLIETLNLNLRNVFHDKATGRDVLVMENGEYQYDEERGILLRD